MIMTPLGLWPRLGSQLQFRQSKNIYSSRRIVPEDNPRRQQRSVAAVAIAAAAAAEPGLLSRLSRISPADFRKAVEKLVEARTKTSSRRSDRVSSLCEFIFARPRNTIAQPRQSGKKGN